MAIAIQQKVNQASGRIYIRQAYTSTSKNRRLTLEEETASDNPFTISKDIRLSQRDFEYFVSRLFVDEEPNDTMKQLAQSYKEEFG